jgi:hypothetical protein
MLRNEILSKTQWVCFGCVRFSAGRAGCIGLAFGLDQMNSCEERGMQVILHVASLDGIHGGSSRSVACLKDARLEQSLECLRREGKNGLQSQAYAD